MQMNPSKLGDNCGELKLVFKERKIMKLVVGAWGNTWKNCLQMFMWTVNRQRYCLGAGAMLKYSADGRPEYEIVVTAQNTMSRCYEGRQGLKNFVTDHAKPELLECKGNFRLELFGNTEEPEIRDKIVRGE